MNQAELKARTQAFGLRIIRVSDALPSRRTAEVIGRQLVRCGTSVGSNYRSACRAKSLPDFIAKLAIVEEEADETGYWLEMLVASGLMSERRLGPLIKEADEILRIVVASLRTAKRRRSRA